MATHVKGVIIRPILASSLSANSGWPKPGCDAQSIRGNPMKPERWREIDQLLEAALERQPEERASFLAAACAGDESLRLEVESLLRSDEAAESFIEEPATALVAEVIAEQSVQAATHQLTDATIEPLVGPRHPFLWVIWLVSVIIAALFAYAAFVLVQKG